MKVRKKKMNSTNEQEELQNYALLSLSEYKKLQEQKENHTHYFSVDNMYFLVSVINILLTKHCSDIYVETYGRLTTLYFKDGRQNKHCYTFQDYDWERYKLHSYKFCVEVLRL